MTSKPTKRPTHTAYLVDGEGKEASWLEIGALWTHDDGQGFTLTLKAMPLDGRVVIRQRKPKDSKEGVAQ